ncbi:MAG: Chorismate binding-like protein, partial [Pseudonocardiales bacterium]|nr:Chorismate binding-like protein [Pseudonocardiales bacterium]
MSALTELSRLRCRVVSIPLGDGAPPDVFRAAAGSDGLVCLSGVWAGGGAIIASEPLLVLPPDEDPLAALSVQPRVDAVEGAIGGGWFGWLAYDGPSRLAFYDHLLRYVHGTWFFEALWSDERDAL